MQSAISIKVGVRPANRRRVNATTTRLKVRRCTTSGTAGSSTWNGRSAVTASPIPTTCGRSISSSIPRRRRRTLDSFRSGSHAATTKGQDYVVDVTCAACHTGELHITRNSRRTAIRIDGGQGMHAFTDTDLGHFVPELGLAVITTVFESLQVQPLRAQRAWPRGRRARQGAPVGRFDVGDRFVDQGAARIVCRRRYYPVQEGFGRTDALARIANTVFGDHISDANYRDGDGPVNFPFFWNIWKFDWVQYGASVSQPMARNVGESMGTGAVFKLVDDYGRPIPAAERYRTSISFDNLARIESTLQTLTPPRWPKICSARDRVSAARGKELYAQLCVGCHGPHIAADALKQRVAPLRLATDPLWMIKWKDVKDVGTDPATAMNFVDNTFDLSPIGLDLEDVRALLKKELDAQKTRMADLLPALQKELAQRKSGRHRRGHDCRDRNPDRRRPYPLTDAEIAQRLDALDLKKVSSGVGLNILGLIIRDRYYQDRHYSDEARGCFEGFGMLDLPQVVPATSRGRTKGSGQRRRFSTMGRCPICTSCCRPCRSVRSDSSSGGASSTR